MMHLLRSWEQSKYATTVMREFCFSDDTIGLLDLGVLLAYGWRRSR